MFFIKNSNRHAIQQKSHRDFIQKFCSPTVQRHEYDSIQYRWKIRFVPKTISVRYLASAQTPFNIQENLDHLKYTNEILKYLRRQNPDSIGIATFNRTDMHHRWQDYCRRAPPLEETSMIYFLVKKSSTDDREYSDVIRQYRSKLLS